MGIEDYLESYWAWRTEIFSERKCLFGFPAFAKCRYHDFNVGNFISIISSIETLITEFPGAEILNFIQFE